MKIGLVTIYSVPNYGSVLQAFATQTLLQKMGHECILINYIYPNKWHYEHGIERVKPVRRMINSLSILLGIKVPYRKQRMLALFRKKYLHLTKQYPDFKCLQRENWSDFDLFVVGSDQVWNTTYHKGDKTFLLSFLPDKMKRISIASSFALNKLPEQYTEKYRKGMRFFSNISVREEDGINIINRQLGIEKEVFVCLDPTLLLSKEDWMHIIPRSRIPNRPYILFYMWCYAFEPRPYIYEVVDYWKRQLGISEVVALEGFSKKSCNMKCAEDSTIPEFIDYFANASLVITSSFHGTAFALNFSRPLISIVPNNAYDNRQKNLCNSLGASSSIIEVGQNVKEINPYYDTNIVEKRIQERRKECLQWINNAIQ